MDSQKVEEFLYKFGEVAHAAPLPAAVAAHVSEIRYLGPFETNQCYSNAQRMTVFDTSEKISYCEGFMELEGVKIPHAWCSMSGYVIDPTLPAHMSGHSTLYFGVCVPRIVLIRMIRETRMHMPCVDREKFWDEYVRNRTPQF